MNRARRRALAKHTEAREDQFEESFLRLAIVLLVALKIGAIIVFISALGFDGFQPPKSVLSRAFEIVLVAAVVLMVVRFGTAIFPRTRLHWTIAAFAATNLA